MRYRRLDKYIRDELELMARKTRLPLRDGYIEHKLNVFYPYHIRVWCRDEMEQEDRTY